MDQFVDHRQVEGVIRARADLKEAGGLAGGDVGADVNDGQFAAVFHGIHQIVDFLDIDGLEDVAELQDHVTRIFQIIGHVLAPPAGQRQGRMLHIAGAGGVMVAVVGASQPAQERAMDIAEGPAAIRQGNGFAAVLFLDLRQFFGHMVEGFIPGDLAPFAFAAGTLTDHWRLRAFMVVDQRLSGGTPRTNRPFHGRYIGIAFDKGNLTVLRINLDGATYRAHTAYAVD